MYIPAAFQQPDREKVFELIERNGFGLLVSSVDGEPFATHLPFRLDRGRSGNGSLLGHMALANPQWRHAEGQTVLAVFSGPHAYVSPTWYQADHMVPTWNYLAVHVYGKLQVFRDDETLAVFLRDFAAFYEASLPEPWTFDPRSDFSRKMLKAIAGFRINIDRIEGKWKLGQNRTPEQRNNAAWALRSRSDENSQAIAELMMGGG